MAEKRCRHSETVRGPDIPRVYGSFRSEICLDCRAYRKLSHANQEPMSKWIKTPLQNEWEREIS